MGVADSSSPDPQNTPVQIFTIDTRVRTLLARAMTTIGTLAAAPGGRVALYSLAAKLTPGPGAYAI